MSALAGAPSTRSTSIASDASTPETSRSSMAAAAPMSSSAGAARTMSPSSRRTRGDSAITATRVTRLPAMLGGPLGDGDIHRGQLTAAKQRHADAIADALGAERRVQVIY